MVEDGGWTSGGGWEAGASTEVGGWRLVGDVDRTETSAAMGAALHMHRPSLTCVDLVHRKSLA